MRPANPQGLTACKFTLNRKGSGGGFARCPVLWSVASDSSEVKEQAPVMELDSWPGLLASKVHHLNHHLCKNCSQQCGCNIPEEVPHGFTSFMEETPTPEPLQSLIVYGSGIPFTRIE